MNKATAIREMRKLLKASSFEDAYNIYKEFLIFPELTLISDEMLRKNIVKHYITQNDKALLKFANGLTDDLFDFVRYEQYKEFRNNHKFDGGSKQYFKLKYGDAWKQFFNKSKNTRFNMYNIDDYIEKRGFSYEQARQKVDEIKKKTTPSLESYIQKYGEVVGKQKFDKICRRHKNYIDYWNMLYPNDPVLACAKFREYTASASLKNVNYYLKHGYTEDEAAKLISEHQLKNAGVHRSYYENLGLPNDEIDAIMLEINKRKDSASLKFISSKFPNSTQKEIEIEHKKHNLEKSSIFRNNGYLKKDDPNLDKRVAYYKAVDYYTSRAEMPPCPGKRGKGSGYYHIDHRYSRLKGYQNNIPPYIIGHVTNLQWLLSEVNCSKKEDCSITEKELLEGYLKYENKINKKT
jgi:hypothetical protein